jgi:hypothetical protein
VLIEFGLVGADLNPLASGASPFFTTPTLTTTIGLSWTDATLRLGGADILVLTGFEFMLDMRGATVPVIGSILTPDVILNNATLTGSISAVRQDLSNLTRFASETELEFQAMLVAPQAEPKDFGSFFISRLKFMTPPDEQLGNDGAMTETMQWEAGDKEVATGYDDTMLSYSTSAP